MAPSSGNSRTPSLKTYSKRVNHNEKGPSSKKRRVEEPPLFDSPPQVKKIKGTTIRSYFKPLQSSSNPSTTRSPQLSLDPLEPTYTPSSSPPSISDPFIEYPRKSQKRPRRRLTTRPALAPLVNMSSQDKSDNGSDDCLTHDALQCSEVSQLKFSSGDVTGTEDQNQYKKTKLSQLGSSSNAAGSSTHYLHQAQLDMGISAIKVCKECGMQYNTTLAEDRRSHEKYHNGVVEAKQPNIVPAGVNLMDKYVGDARHLIRVIDHRGSAALKQGAEKALEATRHDLGGWIVSPQRLWAEITNPHHKSDPNPVPCYKVYLYLINLQVVGLVLAERIARGGAYYHGPVIINENGRLPSVGIFRHEGEEQDFVYGDLEYKCYMSIDRIWTRRDLRRNGFATLLVDYARQSFVPGLSLSKEQIAFSRPTSAGREFAKKYCEDVSFKGGPFLSDLDSAEVAVKNDKFNVC